MGKQIRKEWMIAGPQWDGQGTKETGRDGLPVQTKWSDNAFIKERQTELVLRDLCLLSPKQNHHEYDGSLLDLLSLCCSRCCCWILTNPSPENGPGHRACHVHGTTILSPPPGATYTSGTMTEGHAILYLPFPLDQVNVMLPLISW